MCGRYARSKDKAALVEEFAVEEATDQDLPAADYNIAPTKSVYVVAQRPVDESTGAPRRVLAVARWGLVPFWAKDPAIGNRLVNARAESAAAKPAFRRAYAERRCLVPAAGYYEWHQQPRADGPGGSARKPRKQPYFIRPADGSSLAMAGLYEFWRDPADTSAPWLMTTTILTTAATGALVAIHDRMPLPIPHHLWQEWLDPSTDPDGVAAVLSQATAGHLVAHPVSTMVNNVRNNGSELVAPLQEAQ